MAVLRLDTLRPGTKCGWRKDPAYGGFTNVRRRMAIRAGWKSPHKRRTMLPEDFHDHVLNAGKAARILLDRYFDRMETILNSLEVSTALDVGCSKGYITNFIDEMNVFATRSGLQHREDQVCP